MEVWNSQSSSDCVVVPQSLSLLKLEVPSIYDLFFSLLGGCDHADKEKESGWRDAAGGGQSQLVRNRIPRVFLRPRGKDNRDSGTNSLF